MADTAVKDVPRAPRVISQNFGVSEFKRNRWFYELTEAQQPSDLERPEFWSDVVDHIRGHDKTKGVGDRIEFDKPDTGWAGTARINAIGQGFMKIGLFEQYHPAVVDVAENSPLLTKWNVGKRCHEVIRASSKDVVASNFQTKPDAVAWITNHLKDMAA